jgi:GNAT superfamily N-acetyltransferase
MRWPGRASLVETDAPRGTGPLRADHDVTAFGCGSAGLDAYVRTQALHDQQAHKSRTYVIVVAGRVVGYYSLAAAGLQPLSATVHARAGQGRQPIPAILLARLAVDAGHQGRGLGEAMLLDALRRSSAAAETIGARIVLVHAADKRARAFYERYGFQRSPASPLHLMLLMKDVRATLGDG